MKNVILPKLRYLQRSLFERRMLRYLIKGHDTQKITEFDDEFNQKLKNKVIQNLSVYQIIHDFKPNEERDKVGFCFERSFLMFISNKDAVFVKGKNKILELKYDKNSAQHAWIEVGDFVYDPTTVTRYPKSLYYKMLKVTNVDKVTHEELAHGHVHGNFVNAIGEYLKLIQARINQQNRINEMFVSK